MISLQNERFSSLNSSTVAVKFCDVIVSPARSGRDLAYTVYRAYVIYLHVRGNSLWRRSQHDRGGADNTIALRHRADVLSSMTT